HEQHGRGSGHHHVQDLGEELSLWPIEGNLQRSERGLELSPAVKAEEDRLLDRLQHPEGGDDQEEVRCHEQRRGELTIAQLEQSLELPHELPARNGRPADESPAQTRTQEIA